MPKFISGYEHIRTIGEGASASVYKVRQTEFGYIRALKVISKPIVDENDKAWKSLVEECKVLLCIGNGFQPNIVRIYPPKLIDHFAVVEMDYVQGESLRNYVLDKKFVPIDEALNFIRQIVSALAYCHYDVYRFLMDPKEDNLQVDPEDALKFIVSPAKEKELVEKYRVIHNDLHSNNIIRRDDGQYILLDFGLAIQNGHCVRSRLRDLGAIEYCSPEKLEKDLISTQSDVYSIGILMYEMLTGRVPFSSNTSNGESDNAAEDRVKQQHLHQAPAPIEGLRKAAFEACHPGETYRNDIPAGLTDIVMKCLAKRPEDRYSDAKVLLAEIEKALAKTDKKDGAGPLLISEPDEDEPKGKTQKKRIIAMASLLILAAIVCGAIWFSRNGNMQSAQEKDIIAQQEDTISQQIDSTHVIVKEDVPLAKSDNTQKLAQEEKPAAAAKGDDRTELQPKAEEKPQKESPSLSLPADIQDALNMMVNSDFSREERLNNIPRMLDKFFAPNAKIRTVGDSGIILDSENAEDYLRRIVLSRRIASIEIVGSENDGKITELTIKERNKLRK